MPFRPTDFTQVNHQINQILVSRALSLLGATETDHVLDLFCGLGNFTLPLARGSQQVLGVEGSQALVDRAHAAASHNGVSNVAFQTSDLFAFTIESYAVLMAALGGRIDRVLIDPPREGALAVCEALSQLEGQQRPKRIVYVSCNPATLARDAGVLEQQGGYRLKQAGVVNMFPHTGHVESIAVFE
jgi:23S rRNA (uracil1939-C5)-methyltransferase